MGSPYGGNKCRWDGFIGHFLQITRYNSTGSSAIAEGLRNAIATTNHPILKRLQSINDLDVYTPKVVAIAAFRYVIYHFL